jgi:hypothetical protein
MLGHIWVISVFRVNSPSVAASNQNRRRSLLAEKKKVNKERKEDTAKPKNNQAAQAIEQAGRKAGGINHGQAGESKTMKVEDI